MNRKLVAFVATGLAFVGSAAVAAPQYDTREATVNYADLDLESAAGIESLYARIRSAVKKVCGTADTLDIAAQADLRACRVAAIDKAIAAVGNEALAARHAGKQEARYARADSGKRS
jgi:UrcA family protein